MYEALKQEVTQAKTYYRQDPWGARERFYYLQGRLDMLRELGQINVQQFMELNHEIVAEGINNPIYFPPREAT